ncbi:hypothetical protein F1D05_05935 [Kribbella qitaiheensis]|uniref:Multidrug resistance protein MdtA-like C-terminal permuted SH3 domain-containing protein n=1 Tax=Kribbella qitaiheensis TaxID=1544730 RepID=A0A7G6WU68_9ACTN|nr:hypothetical protein [Kribbella qitaiheensis]QNE17533.1 hypothetical protein F1D05_05935 [Kribbella qitaiheensis]
MRLLGTVGVACVLGLAGCSGGQAQHAPGQSPTTTPATAAVSRGSIQSVVTLKAAVAAAPGGLVTSPAAGVVLLGSDRVVRIRRNDGSVVPVSVPSGAAVTRVLVLAGQRVPARFPVAEVKAAGFGVVAEVDPASLYRLYLPVLSAKAQVTNGPGPFSCVLLSTVPTRQAGAGSSGGPLRVTCLVPADLPVFEGMPGVLALVTAEERDVLTLPLEAVAGSAARGTVVLVGPAGENTPRSVTLGASDGNRIAILSGLAEGDRVSLSAPNLAGG